MLVTTGGSNAACEFKSIADNQATVAGFRSAMSTVVERISEQVCAHHAHPSKLIRFSGAHELHEWRDDASGNAIAGAHVDHANAFCKYDCASGHFDATGSGDCSPCLASCSTGYTAVHTTATTSGAACISSCTIDLEYCPGSKQSFIGGTSASRTPTSRVYGHQQEIVCGPGYRAVGNPSMICINDGVPRWLKQGRCVSNFNEFDTQIVEASNTCAGQTIARCPYNEVAIGGGMYNAWERGTQTGRQGSNHFEQAHPNGQREWVCDMGEGTDCGHVTCFAICVSAATVVIDDVSADYDHSSHDQVGHDPTASVQCAAGFTVTGIGMRNHLPTFTDASLFEEFSYEDNGAVCNMGAAGTQPDFTCYARCAKASNLGNTGKQLTCVTKTSAQGSKHDLTCDSPFQASDGSGQQAVGVGIKQHRTTFNDYSWFENAQPRGKSSVHCDTGYGWDAAGNEKGLNTCQARCCTYE
jgi:hypothetical protein